MRLIPSAYQPSLRDQRFRMLALGYGISSLGDGMSAVGIAWLALQISAPPQHSLAVGAAVAAYTLPGAAGIFLQRPLRRFDTQRLLLTDCGLRAFGLGAAAILGALGHLGVLTYIALLTVSGLLGSWGTAARYTLVAELLPDQEQLSGNALLGTLVNIGIVAGPAMAGLITAASGAEVVLAIDAGTWLAYAACIPFIKIPSRTARPAATTTSMGTTDARATGRRPTSAADAGQARTGLRVLLASPTLLGLLVVTLPFYFFYGPVEVALPIFVEQDLHRSAVVLGIFWTAFGVGALAGSLGIGLVRRPPLFAAALTIIFGWGAALSVVPLAGAPGGIAVFALAGCIWAPYPVLVMTALQQWGRGSVTSVAAAWTSATTLATPLGTAAGGPLVASLGPGPTLLLSALATIALVPVAAGLRRRQPMPSRSR